MAKKKAPGPGAKRLCLRATSKSGPQAVRANPEKSWTPEAQGRFLDTLAATSSIVMAAEASGFDKATCYYHRRKDPCFANAWDEAKYEGVARVELELVRAAEEALARGFAPMPAADAAQDKPAEWRFPPLTFDQALAVVRLFRGRDADRNGGRARRHWHWTPMDPQKAREVILRNVEAVRRAALGGEGGEGAALA